MHPIAAADQLIRDGRRYRYRIDIQYDGTEFSGMQWQPDRRTVQRCLEDALSPLFGASVRVIPSSRTDAGVHAALQTVHIDAPVQRNPLSIVRAGNVDLPYDVRILRAEEVDESFHARFSAKWRGYDYMLSAEPVALQRHLVWQMFHPLDKRLLFDIAGSVKGTHSFASFAHESPLEKHRYECTVLRSEWTEMDHMLVYRIDATRFVHGMVRMLVGTMIDIAAGRRDLSSMEEIISANDNRKAGTKAPATGLTLRTVGYRDWPDA